MFHRILSNVLVASFFLQFLVLPQVAAKRTNFEQKVADDYREALALDGIERIEKLGALLCFIATSRKVTLEKREKLHAKVSGKVLTLIDEFSNTVKMTPEVRKRLEEVRHDIDSHLIDFAVAGDEQYAALEVAQLKASSKWFGRKSKIALGVALGLMFTAVGAFIHHDEQNRRAGNRSSGSGVSASDLQEAPQEKAARELCESSEFSEFKNWCMDSGDESFEQLVDTFEWQGKEKWQEIQGLFNSPEADELYRKLHRDTIKDLSVNQISHLKRAIEWFVENKASLIEAGKKRAFAEELLNDYRIKELVAWLDECSNCNKLNADEKIIAQRVARLLDTSDAYLIPVYLKKYCNRLSRLTIEKLKMLKTNLLLLYDAKERISTPSWW